jgi:hypothetical protein
MLIRSFATPALRVLAAMVTLLVAKSVAGVTVAYTLGEAVTLGWPSSPPAGCCLAPRWAGPSHRAWGSPASPDR